MMMKNSGYFPIKLAAVAFATLLWPVLTPAVNERNNGEWPWELKLHGWHDREIAEDLGSGWFLNVGPTGIRMRITHEHPAYMTVKYVFRDSPAHGLINIGDIIVGANGTRMTTPHTFGRGSRGRATWDGPMVTMASLIEDSQAADGKIDFIVWPGGDKAAEKTVTVQVEPIGRFSPTWPFNCERSDRLMIEFGDFLVDEHKREGGFGRPHANATAVLALMATGQPKHDQLVKQILSGYGGKRYDPNNGTGFPVWGWGHDAIVMGEHYILTQDRSLLPAIESLTNAFALGQDAESDGYSHRPFPFIRQRMAEGGPKGYGAMAMTGGLGMLGLSLFKEAGLEYDETNYLRLHDAFLRSVGDSGAIGYGFEGRDHAVIRVSGEKPASPNGVGYRIPGDMESVGDYEITWPTPADPRYRPTDWVEKERGMNKVYDQGETLLVVRDSAPPEPTKPMPHSGGMVDHHGRSGLGALAHAIGNRDNPGFNYLADHMAKGAALSGKALLDGHASTHMHVVWGSLGAALADERDFRQYMEDVKWWFIMAHTHNGGFVIMPGRDYASTDHVYGGRIFPTACATLVLALKEKRLQITGAARGESSANGSGSLFDSLSTTPREARTMAGEKIAMIDESLLAALVELSRNNQLEQLLMPLSTAGGRVWLAQVNADQTLTFKAAEGEGQASFKLSDLNTEDKSWLARLVARQRPEDREAQARAGIYMELSGDTRVADQYFNKAGEHFKTLLADEFE